MQIRPDSAKIRRWREERGWSQEHLAELAGLGVRTIQRIENGDPASQDSVTALAAAFNVDVLAMTKNVEAEAEKLASQKNQKARDALRLSFGIHLASYAFGIVVFTGISLADGVPGYAMLWPLVGWTMGVAGHALTVAIVEMVTYYDQKSLASNQ
ncbi:MAG: helix-turn-helix domain-containing protein [Pseudomonadota bacterium]